MKLFIETKEKLYKCGLSSKVYDSISFNFVSNKTEKTITIDSINGEWNIVSNSEYSIGANGMNIDHTNLKNNDIYTLNFIDDTLQLYCLNSFDIEYVDLDISNVNTVLVGNADNANIRISIMDGEIQINKTENGYVLNVQNLLSFLNSYKTSSSALKIGDIIFIRGTKIIFMGSYIRVCGIKPVSYNLNLYAKKLVDNTQYVPINELERNISLYDKDNLFFHTPQLKFNIQQADITIDAPPEEVKNEEFPAIFTIGASLMIGLTSVITGVTSVIGIINKTTTIGAAAPSLAISAAMIISSVHSEELLSNENINDFIKQKDEYNNFQTLLFKMIDERNLKDSDVYNKVHIDRRLFSKIRNYGYHPSKETIILLGFALELNEQEIDELLDSVSYSLPKNNHYDLIIRFCFINKIFKIDEINKLLDRYHCKLFSY